MSSEKEWLAGLQENEEVIVGSLGDERIEKVKRITPSRQHIILFTDERFNASGKKLNTSKWGGAWLAPVTEQARARIMRKALVGAVSRLVHDLNYNALAQLSDDRLKELLEVLQEQNVMTNQETKVKNGEDTEDLRLYVISEADEIDTAVVSIGHIDFRARFLFTDNKRALRCYQALKEIAEMYIN